LELREPADRHLHETHRRREKLRRVRDLSNIAELYADLESPALKSALVFGGIAGIMSGEPAESDDGGRP